MASGARSRVRPGAVRATRTGVRAGTTTRRRTIGLGAVTVISGSCVEEGGVAASWAIAPPAAAHSSSQLAPPRWKARLFWNLIVPVLMPSTERWPDFDFPRNRPADRSEARGQFNQSIRRWEVRAIGMRGVPSSGERTWRRSQDTGDRRAAAARASAVLRIAHRLRAK